MIRWTYIGLGAGLRKANSFNPNSYTQKGQDSIKMTVNLKNRWIAVKDKSSKKAGIADDDSPDLHHLFTKPKKCPKCGGKMDEAGESNANWFDICKKCGSVFYYQSK